MKTKRMFWTLLIETLIISVLAVGMLPVQAQPAGTLALSPNTIYVETGNEPAGWPSFDVNVTITDVTNIVGAVFSIHWDPTILNFTSIVAVPPFPIPGYPDYLLPTGAGGISGILYTVNYTEGNLKQAAQIQLAPFSPKTFTAPSWGWVAKLTFEFIGTPPSVGSINTNITIVDNPGALMATEWTPNGVAWNKFQTLGTCEFTYVGPQPPVASFTEDPATPHAGEQVTFTSTSSDPDGTIVSYEWDFGDGNITTVANPVIRHTYSVNGTYTVNLTVTDNDGLTDSATEIKTVLPPLIHDVAVTDVVPSTTVVLVGESVEINVTVRNEGDSEESFNLTLYADGDPVETKAGLNLAAGANQTYAFNWTTTAIGNFTIKAEVPQVPGEVDTTDNTWNSTTVWYINVYPEFPTLIPLLLALAVLAVSTIVLKRRRRKPSTSGSPKTQP